MTPLEELELLDTRIRLRCPPEHLNRAAPYEAWGDLDGLVSSTTMQLDDGIVDDRTAPNVVISLFADMHHRATLDLDRSVELDEHGFLVAGGTTWDQLGVMTLIPSTHNHHGYGDRAMPWGAYAEAIEALQLAGVLGTGWASLSLRRGFTLLRAPGVMKPAIDDHEEPW